MSIVTLESRCLFPDVPFTVTSGCDACKRRVWRELADLFGPWQVDHDSEAYEHLSHVRVLAPELDIYRAIILRHRRSGAAMSRMHRRLAYPQYVPIVAQALVWARSDDAEVTRVWRRLASDRRCFAAVDRDRGYVRQGADAGVHRRGS